VGVVVYMYPVRVDWLYKRPIRRGLALEIGRTIFKKVHLDVKTNMDGGDRRFKIPRGKNLVYLSWNG
jgi:hypothetical protein